MTLDEAIAVAIADPPTPRASEPRPGSTTYADDHGLSPRELEVLKLMADGLTNQQIADALFISHRTIASHASSILGKLVRGSRTAAIAWAIRHGLA